MVHHDHRAASRSRSMARGRRRAQLLSLLIALIIASSAFGQTPVGEVTGKGTSEVQGERKSLVSTVVAGRSSKPFELVVALEGVEAEVPLPNGQPMPAGGTSSRRQ